MTQPRSTEISAPVARKVPTERTHHGDTFIDNYEWLREKENPEVVAHLEAENAYTNAVTADQEALREAIFQEIKGRTLETDLSVPSRKDNWWYFARTIEGSDYPVYARVAASNSGDALADWTPPEILPGVELEGEQLLLDGNAEAEGQPFFALGGAAVTTDGHLYAYAVDNAGDERFTIRFKDLRSGEALADVIEGAFYDVVFSPDGTELFYTVVDSSWRPYQIRSHRLGTPVSEDTVLIQEDDPGMWLGFSLSAERTHMVVGISCAEFSEIRILDFADREAGLRTVVPRDARVLYEAEPFVLNSSSGVVLSHNRDAVNSMVSFASWAELAKPLAEQQWTTLVAHSPEVRVNSVAVLRDFLVLSVREETLERVQFLAREGLGTPAQATVLEPRFDEELFTAGVAAVNFEAPVVRLGYDSYFVPSRVYDFALPSPAAPQGELLLRREKPVLGGYQASDYVASREWATAHDGARVPLSVLRHKSVQADGTAPALVYGYGSYEASMDPFFAVPRLSLLDRGVVFVVAHVRGGGELGRAWYDTGKKLSKKNTFTDFVDATDYVVSSGWADPARVVAMGGSAGGLLMGAVANLAPEKYVGVVAQVPFVDALTSILDPDLPLSALEWEEWGNPITDPQVYEYMKSYTPYENVRAVDYPRIAAVTSFNDTRVLYVEPAKWVQELREKSTGDAPIVLKTEMDGGHGGGSGRYTQWRDRAWDFAFALDALDARELLPGAGLKS